MSKSKKICGVCLTMLTGLAACGGNGDSGDSTPGPGTSYPFVPLSSIPVGPIPRPSSITRTIRLASVIW
jgi:hypothetical protein